MSSKRRDAHVTKLCATVEKLTAVPIIQLGNHAIIYNTAGHREDARALMALKKDIENSVEVFKREAKERYS